MMFQRLFVFIWLSVCSLSGCQPATLTWQPLATPVAALDFTLLALTGGPVTLSGLRGQVVVMEFWATWCGPCQYSSPSLEVISRRFRGRGVTVLLINEGQTAEAVRAWARGRFTTPILLDEGVRVADAYGVNGLPQLFVIDQQGMIRYAESGYTGGLERNLSGVLGHMLATPKAAKHGG